MPAWAADSIVTLRAGAHPDHDRIVMDWHEVVNYDLSGQAPDYILTFAKSAQISTPKIASLKRFSAIKQLSNDPLVLSIMLAPGNTLHLSRAGNGLVIDAVPGKVDSSPKAPDAKNSKAVADLKDQIAKVDKWSGNQDAGGPPPGTVNKKEADKIPALIGDTGPGGRPLTLAEIAARDAQKKDKATPIETKPVDPTKSDSKKNLDTNGDQPEVQQQFTPLPSQLVEPTAVAKIKLKVPPRVKFAAFMRGKKLWLVLDQPNLENPTDENGSEPDKFGPVTRYQVGQGSGTAYRIQLKDNEFPAVTKADGDALLLTVYQQMPLVMPVGLPVEVENSNDQGPRLKISGKGFASPLRVSDPDVGDTLLVIPAASESGSVTNLHRWPQLATVPAIHGVVLDPLVDNIAVNSSLDGIIIARPPAGLTLSGIQGLVKNRDAGTSQQVFDLKRWRVGSLANYRTLKAQLQNALADIRGQERLGRIMQIAQFEFAQGYGYEADGWLRLAAQEFPDTVNVPEYLLLRGAVHVVMHDPYAADKDLAQPNYAYEPEVALWRGWAAAQTEDYQRARYFFALSNALLHNYPDPYFVPVTLAAAETALLTGDVIAGGALIDGLKRHKNLSAVDKGELAYLEGLKARLNGNDAAAKNDWMRAVKSKNDMYAAKSQLLLVEEGLKNKTMDDKHAMLTLELLRFAWRGDRTELATLVMLADLYMKDGQGRKAFEAWQTILHYYPTEPQAETARQNISKNFVTMFGADQQGKLQPIEALALYRDFIHYAPTPQAREQITRQLIDRLVEVGMYHEAADVYAPLVQPVAVDGAPPPPPPTAKDVLRLAGIYLLDNQPDKAIAVLGSIQGNTLPYLEQTEYELLLARAEFQQGKFDDALTQLAPLSDSNSQRLRADIYWRKQAWADVAKTLPMLIGTVTDDGKLSHDQAHVILQQAVALSLANDSTNLEALRDKYGTAMDATDDAISFRLVTRPPKGSEVQSVQSIQSRIGEVDSFGDFLKNYEKGAAPPTPLVPVAAPSTIPSTADSGAKPAEAAPKQDAAPPTK